MALKVADCCYMYDHGLKSQGQIYFNSVLQLVMRTPLSFLMEGVNISRKIAYVVLNTRKLYDSLYGWSQGQGRLNLKSVSGIVIYTNSSFVF